MLCRYQFVTPGGGVAVGPGVDVGPGVGVDVEPGVGVGGTGVDVGPGVAVGGGAPPLPPVELSVQEPDVSKWNWSVILPVAVHS